MKRRTTCACFVLLLSGLARADDAPLNLVRPEATTVEKELFPPACRRGFEIDLPFVHKAFDALPEEVFPHLFSLQSSSGSVQRWRRMLARRGVDIDGYQYISSGLATDADAILVQLDHGRVVRLGYFFPFLNPGRARAIIKPFAGVGVNAVADDRHFAVTAQNIRVYGELVGEHAWSKSEPGAIMINGTAGISTSPDTERSGSYPALIEIGVDPVDWYLTHHDLTPAVSMAIRSAVLWPGMTPDDANAAMGFEGSVMSSDADGNHTVEWTWSHQAWEHWHHAEECAAPKTVVDQRIQAIFRNGRLSSWQRITP